MDDNRKLKLFMNLSQTLTGFDDLPEEIGRDYLSRLSLSFGDQAITALLTSYETLLTSSSNIVNAVKNYIIDDKDKGSLARESIMLWYTAQFKDLNGQLQNGTDTQYQNSLIWRAIQAHPPGFAGGQYGYWKDAPEDLT